MSGIFVFSADTTEARRSLSVSIEQQIAREKIIPHFSDATYAELLEIERNTPGFYAWGVPPGPQNIMNWLYMATGDYVLGVVNGTYRYAAEVVGRYENEKAAAAIWGQDAEGQSREYIFFISRPVKLRVPLAQLKSWLPMEYDPFDRVEDNWLQAIRTDFGTVSRFFKENILQRSERSPALDVSGIFRRVEDTATSSGIFTPVSVTDSRTKHFEAIIRRRGHPRFRQALMRAYGRRCAITRCEILEVLEGALIRPYQGEKTYHVSNGLLLRADLHTLFDLGQLSIQTKDMTVVLSEKLMRSSYKVLAGRRIFLPEREELKPSAEALDAHRMTWGL